MAGDPTRTVEISIPSELGYEKIAMEAAVAVARQIGFSSDRIEDLRTAVSEACLNAIEHGNRLDDSTRVVVVLMVQPSSLEVYVADTGKQPIPARQPQPGRLEDNRGWGMFLIQNLMDQVQVQSEPKVGNLIRMVIRLNK